MDFLDYLLVFLLAGLDVFLIAIGYQEMLRGRQTFDRVLGSIMLFVGSASVLIMTYGMQLHWVTR